LLSGCGTGLDLAYLPPETQVTALDAVPAMVRRTKARARTLGRAVDAQVGDAHALPFEDDSFDVVLLHLLLSVLPDPGAVLAEAVRVLAPGGRISIYDKFLPPGTPPSLLRRLGNPVARLLVSDFNRRLWPMLAGTNLDLVTHREAGLWGLYTASVARLGSGQPGRQQ
jgi:ubiquinone/menaquinone biosynthesis C-methylase UbiE